MDSRNKYDLRGIKNNEEVFAVYPKAYQNRNFSMIPCQVFQMPKQLIVMKMVIILYTKVIDMDLTILTMNGIKKEIEYFYCGSFTHGACVNRPYDIASC